SAFQDEVFELYARLCDDILPNELLDRQETPNFGHPPHWQSILNAAWMYYLLSERERFDVFRDWAPEAADSVVTEENMEERYKRLMKHNDFTGRAVEISIFHRNFLDNKE